MGNTATVHMGLSETTLGSVLSIPPSRVSQACTAPPRPLSQLTGQPLFSSRDGAPFFFAAAERGHHRVFCFSLIFHFEILFVSSLYILISPLNYPFLCCGYFYVSSILKMFSLNDFHHGCFINLCQSSNTPGILLAFIVFL